ncbi:hypothetical protein JS531_00010 [Bifidobacterium sp. CP2]|uniref:hypothetical protein n=1 Tax=Bifidobacterium TaxID=1678 RepID=UPI001BDD5087|nr:MULTISPECIES: hypothetical protein [Bifidobacterium]MBT1180388.1 hypothetical protein [Bifidobacterium sp. CP2]MBW3080565.1 hypothetical protein [Bifidobacterium saguinibicoloris]
MHVYDTRELFDAELGSVKKWMRVGQALDIATTLTRNVAYSIGDSLVYWWDRTPAIATSDMTGHRRYLFVCSPQDGDMRVMVAPKSQLTSIEAYSDLTDRERFMGPANIVTVPAGGVFVADIDEAYKVCSDPDVQAVVLHVTVEGYSFPNK